MNANEIIFPIGVINLFFQAPLRTYELLLLFLVFILFCFRDLLDVLVFPLDLGLQTLGLLLDVYINQGYKIRPPKGDCRQSPTAEPALRRR